MHIEPFHIHIVDAFILCTRVRRARTRENALPWVMTHRWPGSFFEFYKGQPDEGEYIYRE